VLAELLEATGRGLALGALSADIEGLAIPEATAIVRELQSFQGLLVRLRKDLEVSQAVGLATPLTAVQQQNEELNARYYSLRQEQQSANESLKREDTLKQQVIHLERLEGELERFLAEEQQLIERRRIARENIKRISDQIYRLRLQEVDQI